VSVKNAHDVLQDPKRYQLVDAALVLEEQIQQAGATKDFQAEQQI
jgi:hypothetical protein